jgi:hypothetical protein
MKRYVDGNTGNINFVFLKDGKIHSSLPLDIEYNHDRCAFELGIVAAQLLDMAQRYYDEVKALKDENARLTKRAKRPTLKPSLIGKQDKDYKATKKKRTETRNPDKSKLKVSQTITLKPKQPLPKGSRFKGYKKFMIQELEISLHNICYQRERWKAPDGHEILGELPAHLKHDHFGAQLRQFVLYQYFHNHVTQPLLLNQLRELGVSISSGQLSNLLTKKNSEFTAEKEALLVKGLRNSHYIQVDDTGSRHQGKNGYCTQFGNQDFAYFQSSGSKSKGNFLTILQGRQTGFRLNQVAYDYLKRLKNFSNWSLWQVEYHLKSEVVYHSKNEWLNYLQCQPYTKGSYKLLTEAAMIGYLTQDIFESDLTILSDEAKQFDINSNAGCWVHAERKLTKVIPGTEKQSHLKEKKLKQFWQLYDTLKSEVEHGCFSYQRKYQLKKRFDNLCKDISGFKKLNVELNHLHSMKATLLKCLDKPQVPLHNNQSESDIREYVKRRKISGCTKSEDGREAVDTYLSLKKTCQRHGISFMTLLKDRLENLNKLPELSEFIRKY